MKKLKYIFLVLLGVVLFSCSSSSSIYENTGINIGRYISDDSSNLLITSQSRLVLPEGWKFEMAKSDESKYDLFKFSSSDKSITGSFAYMSFDYIVNCYSPSSYLAKLYAEDYDSVVLSPVLGTVNYNTYLVECYKGLNNKEMMIYNVCEGKGANFIYLFSTGKYISNEYRNIYKIFASYRLEKKNLDARIIKGFYSFRCGNGDWKWGLDNKDMNKGYTVYHKDGDKFLIFRIKETDISNIKDLKMENTYYDVSPYDVTFSFANQEINGVAKGITKDVDGYSYLQILFEKRGVNYLISIEANKYYNKAPEKLINLIEVVELMNDYIYFYD